MILFKNRIDAGKQLSEKLKVYTGQKDVVVIGMPRGGVVVAFEIAKKLNLPLDIIASRKIGMPKHPEFAVGAITDDGKEIFDFETINVFGLKLKDLEDTVKAEKGEAKRRMREYRAGRETLDLKDKTVILVDDGIATGLTMQATILSAKDGYGAKKIIVAVPVIPKDQIKKLKTLADEVIYLASPVDFGAISPFYHDFEQVEDKQVINLMKQSL